MAPLILHNVPDDELYVGEDGVQRPYAMVFPQDSGVPSSSRGRRGVPEKGSFGKSTRRSRSKTGTPARRDDPSIVAADKIWGDWHSKLAEKNSHSAAAIGSGAQSSNADASAASRKLGHRVSSQTLNGNKDVDAAPARQTRVVNVPTEVILRGYRNINQQYAAIAHYEALAGRICEDYPRSPPNDQRYFKSTLRDAAYFHGGVLTPEEKAKVNRADGGEHWIKVTFESAQAADKALYASPQRILGHLVYAEVYKGHPPHADEACPEEANDDGDIGAGFGFGHRRNNSLRRGSFGARQIRMRGGVPDWSSAGVLGGDSGTATIDSATASNADTMDPSGSFDDATTTGIDLNPFANAFSNEPQTQSDNTLQQQQAVTTRHNIKGVQRVALKPAEQAFLPQPTISSRIIAAVPLLGWFTGSMIGSEVPRNDAGEFDWNRASLYWKIIWYLDYWINLCGGDIIGAANKDD